MEVKQCKDKELIMWIAISVLVLFGTNLLFNAWISEGPRVFYDDDLGCIISIKEAESALKFIFNMGANKIRPVAYLFIYLSVKLANNNFEVIDEILLLLNFFNAILVFGITYKIQKNENELIKVGISLISGIMFIASHFAYYNISEIYGIMEGLGITFAIVILYYLFCYIDYGQKKFFHLATVFYGLLLYTHERYFVLFALFIVAIIAREGFVIKKDYKLCIIPVVLFISFWGLRFVLFGNRAADGTGGTNIGDTFNIVTAIKFCFSQVGYILGFNCGPQYLNGVEAGQVTGIINVLLVFRVILIGYVIGVVGKLLINNKEYRKKHLGKISLFVTFIALCIGASSITIRVEMRWIYVSYTAFILLLFYLLDGIKEYCSDNVLRANFLGVILIITLITEGYYRSNYDMLYYWNTKELSKELYCATVEEYGDELTEKELLIISKRKYWENWGDAEWKSFFAPYTDSSNMLVTYVDNISQAKKMLKQNSIVLVEDTENNRYTDVTDFLMLTVNYLYGHYEDGWIDVDCKFEIQTEENETAELVFYYPEDLELKGENRVQIYVNEQLQKEISLTGSLTNESIQIQPNSLNTVQIVSYGWVHENTGRSEDGRLVSTLQVH